MKLVVADASALVEYLLQTERSAFAREVIQARAVSLHVPALCDIEITAALRRAILAKLLPEKRGREALQDYRDLPVTRHSHTLLLDRILELRSNFSAYDATYVALAEQMGASLLTADEGLARAVQHLTRLSVESSAK